MEKKFFSLRMLEMMEMGSYILMYHFIICSHLYTGAFVWSLQSCLDCLSINIGVIIWGKLEEKQKSEREQ